jgi:hypothetical protein
VRDITVDVTAGDIAAARPNVRECPIALAISRSIGRAVIVGARNASIHESFVAGEVELPLQARIFVKDVDHGRTVKPMSFQLSVPDEWSAPDAHAASK